MAALDGRCRVLLETLYLRPDEPSYTDIAAELGMPIGSIGPTRSRCLAKLRRLLEAADGDTVPIAAPTASTAPGDTR